MNYINILSNIAGADSNELKNYSYVERLSYPVLGALIILAATWTSVGLSLKIGNAFNLSVYMTGGIGIFFFSLVLLIEIIMLATLSNSKKGMLARFMLGFCLMLLQALPLQVWFFSNEIKMHRTEYLISKNIEADKKIIELNNVDIKKKELNDSKIELKKANANYLNPPSYSKLTQLEDALGSAQNKVDDLYKKFNNQYMYVKALEIDDVKRDAALRTLNIFERNYKREKEFLENIKTEYGNTQKEYENKLRNEYELAKSQHEKMLLKSEIVENKVNTEKEDNKLLYQQSNNSTFFNDITVLLELMQKDIWILIVSAFVFTIALLIDIIPLLAKMQLQKMPYYLNNNHQFRMNKITLDVQYLEHQTKLEEQKLNLEETLRKIRQAKKLNRVSLLERFFSYID